MSVANDLQNSIARLNELIAAGEKPGRADLELMRRDLSAIREAATRLQDVAFTATTMLGEVVSSLNVGARETEKLAKRAPEPLIGLLRDRARETARLARRIRERLPAVAVGQAA